MNYKYVDLINIGYKKHITIILFFIVIVGCIISSFYFSVYYSSELTALSQSDTLAITYAVDSFDFSVSDAYVEINDKDYDFEIDRYSEVYLYGENYYQTIYITVPTDFKENEIVDITLFYKKEKIIKKIINLMF